MELRKIEPLLTEAGYQIIAISPDPPERLRQTKDRHQLTFQMLSDSKMTAASAFGIAFTLDRKRYEEYIGLGADLEEVSGEKHHQLPVPSVFILGTDGIIRFTYVNPNHKVRLGPDVLLSAAKAALT